MGINATAERRAHAHMQPCPPGGGPGRRRPPAHRVLELRNVLRVHLSDGLVPHPRLVRQPVLLLNLAHLGAQDLWWRWKEESRVDSGEAGRSHWGSPPSDLVWGMRRSNSPHRTHLPPLLVGARQLGAALLLGGVQGRQQLRLGLRHPAGGRKIEGWRGVGGWQLSWASLLCHRRGHIHPPRGTPHPSTGTAARTCRRCP